MFIKAGTALCATALLFACKAQDQATQANSNAEVASAEADSGQSAPVTPEQAKVLMHDRHEGMEKIGKATKAINLQLKSQSSDLAVIRDASAVIDAEAQQASTWFPAGTGPDVGKTRAKPEIWQKKDDFDSKLGDFQRASEAFKTAAASGDMGAVEARFGDLGKTCKACHDSYRAPEKH